MIDGQSFDTILKSRVVSDDDPIIAVCVGFASGIYFFFHGFKLLRRKRLIENTPTSKVRSLAMGHCELYGRALVGDAGVLKSPFSDQDCLYYHFEIEEYRKSGKNSSWVTVKEGTERVPFLLQDDTGEVLVNPKNAEFDIPSDNVFNSGTGRDAPAGITAFLTRQNLAATGLFGWNKRMRYTESFIKPSEMIYVLGTAMDNPHVDEATAAQGHLDVMVGHCAENVFYISDKSETDCVSSHASSVLLQIWGGAALTLVCLAYILYRLGLFN